MSERLPDFEPGAESPALPDDFEGILLQVPAEVPLEPRRALPVAGAFQISAEAAARLPRGDPYAALVVLLIETDAYRSASFRPARSAVRLEPLPAPRGRLRGYFHVDAFEMGRLRPQPGRYFVSAWLDGLRSESKPVRVTGAGGRRNG